MVIVWILYLTAHMMQMSVCLYLEIQYSVVGLQGTLGSKSYILGIWPLNTLDLGMQLKNEYNLTFHNNPNKYRTTTWTRNFL